MRKRRWALVIVVCGLLVGGVGVVGCTDCVGHWATLPSTGLGVFTAVAAPAPGIAWAVGRAPGNGVWETLTAHWTGSVWQRVPSPNPGPTSNILYGVSGSAADDLWAVGSAYVYPEQSRAILLQGDSQGWTLVPLPFLADTSSSLAAIHARARDDAWAVGQYSDAQGTSRPLLLHWDGHTWQQVPAPALRGTSELVGVQARTHDDAWAVGTYSNEDGPQPLTLHWDGQAWQAVFPALLEGGSHLRAVAARAADDAWAVGEGASGPLTLHWDGRAWSQVPGPNSRPLLPASIASADGSNPPELESGRLLGVATGQDGTTWAVGVSGSGSGVRPLLLEWAAEGWQFHSAAPDPSSLSGRKLPAYVM